eukprot:TRINITY_DN5910_c0_g1_i1.p1 TRINITY_DN5910_c0_g1~~TRINITY_DN5910_c0_g1_i1.p1  ORF type:complete len:291 (-),score=81.49 TRINITY_DN5910_c0_g1_i1:107-979(-)
MSNSSPTSPFNNTVLNGRVALITGGGSGICFGIAETYGRHGAKIAIMGRRQNVLEEAVRKLKQSGIDAIYAVGDVRNPQSCVEAVEKVVKEFKKLDILVNGAAGNFLCSAEDLSPNAFKTVVEIDLLGTFYMSKAAFPHLRDSKDSMILNITATLHYGATMYQTHPSAAKAGVDSLTRSLGLEWATHGIRVNGIAPGPIEGTEGMSRLSGPQADGKVRAVPIGRLGTIYDIAFLSVFLATPAASFITGETIVVDGGSWLARPSFITPEVYQMLSESRKQEKDTKQPKAKL